MLISISAAQTLYGVDGNATGATPIAWEFTGPPAPGFCGYPNGPVVSMFPAVGNPICPGPAPFPFPLDGDIAVDKLADEVYVADPAIIARYTSGGACIDSFFSPIFVAGMGIDSFGPLIWITDGVTYGAIVPPPPPGCLGPPVPFVLGPWPVPTGGPFFKAPIWDIDWDPGTGSLWACDGAGTVGNFMPGPVAMAGPFGFFPVVPGPCQLVLPLTGIAVDDALPGTGFFYVTDGFQVAYLAPGGAPAPLTFYTTATCAPVPAPPISGLDFAAHAITYGAPTAFVPPGPTISAAGHSYAGNPAFSVSVTWTPGSVGTLIFGGGGAACPPLLAVGLSGYILPPYIFLATVPMGPTGVGTLTAPLAGPMGLPLDLQWVAVDPATGNLGASEALHCTLSLP